MPKRTEAEGLVSALGTSIVEVPATTAALAERRCQGIVRRFALVNMDLRFLVVSCYLQGVQDGFEACERSNDGREHRD